MAGQLCAETSNEQVSVRRVRLSSRQLAEFRTIEAGIPLEAAGSR